MSKRSTYLRVFGTLLTLALLFYLLSQQGWGEIMAAVKQISWWQLALAFGLMLTSRLAVASRWYVLLHSSNARISFWQSLRVTFAGLFATNFLPTTVGGDVVRLAGAIQLGGDAAICAASLVIDRLVGMAGMAMAVPLGLSNLLASRSLSNHQNPFLILQSTLATGTWWGKIWKKILELIRRVIEAIALWLKHPWSLMKALIFSWIHMLCLFGILYLILTGLGERVPIWTIAGLYSLVYFFTLIPISINGYGLQEVSMTFVFSSLAGASMNSSLITALLFRTLMMLASLPGALFVPDILASREQSKENFNLTKDTGQS